MESDKTENAELTSTMGNLLTSDKMDKGDANDATPTSSTDASTTASTSQIAADDPISSTSSDLVETQKPNDPIKVVSDQDLVDLNLTTIPNEKINENVEDIVQDLENLLGEPTTSYDFSSKSKESKVVDEKGDALLDKAISMDYEEFSNEFNLSEVIAKPEVKDKSTPTEGTVESSKKDDINEESIPIQVPIENETENTIEVARTEPISSFVDGQTEEITSTEEKIEKNESQSTETESAGAESIVIETESKPEEIVEISTAVHQVVESKEENLDQSQTSSKTVEIQQSVNEEKPECKEEHPVKVDTVPGVYNCSQEAEICTVSDPIPSAEEGNTIKMDLPSDCLKVIENEEILHEQNEENNENFALIENIISTKLEKEEKSESIAMSEEKVGDVMETPVSLEEMEKATIQVTEALENMTSSSIVDNLSTHDQQVDEKSDDTDLGPNQEQNVAQNLSQVIEQNVSQNLSQAIEQNLSQNLPQVIEQNLSQNLSQVIEQNVSQNLSQAIEQNLSQNLPQVIEQNLSQNQSQVIEQNVSQNLSQIIEQNVAQNLSQVIEQNENVETSLTVVEESENNCNLSQVNNESENQIVEPSITITQYDEIEENETRKIEEELDGQQSEENDQLKQPLVINVDEVEREKLYSPKIIIKPIKEPEEGDNNVECDERELKGSLKMTITKQSDTMHSILKIYNPDDEYGDNQENESIPKLIIKPILSPDSPKLSSKSSKAFSPGTQRSSSPRITIKPIVKPPEISERCVSPLKITIKPLKTDEKQKHSPKLTIKPIIKPSDDDMGKETKIHSPRVTIKPIPKPQDVEVHSPRITIKPIVKTDELVPRVTIKPITKPPIDIIDLSVEPVEKFSPKITIKPLIKPHQDIVNQDDIEEERARIVLKINKGTLPSTPSRKRDYNNDDDKSEKLTKIKLKFSKEGGHPHIVQPEEEPHEKKMKTDHHHHHHHHHHHDFDELTTNHSKLKEMLSCNSFNKSIEPSTSTNVVGIVEDLVMNKTSSPIVISEESNQSSCILIEDKDSVGGDLSSSFDISTSSSKNTTLMNETTPVAPVEPAPVTPMPRKRGRPRKVPLEVREDFKDQKEEEPKPVESTRPKRSCRGQSVKTTLGIKPRKPRGPGRGRGSKRNMGDREVTPVKNTKKQEPKLSAAKLKRMRETLQREYEDNFMKTPTVLAPPNETYSSDIVMFEEETRMSAETSASTSRAQTPAKQVISSASGADVEESQSSVQSTATTESVKEKRKGPRLEVHQEPEGAVISADQLAEYYWSGGGPYMLQEQVAQFLGIKSFKRKYPNIPRRFVDMQERDFIRESGLACEAMCDLGLTAVNSADILDIMYSDFQDKYEEYCKHQRDRQAKDLTNKQKALSLAASQEKTKLDIMHQAVQSSANWNMTFNKARREHRKACMDLQTLTIHYPKGKMKQINRPKLGHYPIALVPGQFTDYYREYTPNDLNDLPLSTLCYGRVNVGLHEDMEVDSQTDGSGSESESSTSDTDSSYSGSSDAEDCTICKTTPSKRVAV